MVAAVKLTAVAGENLTGGGQLCLPAEGLAARLVHQRSEAHGGSEDVSADERVGNGETCDGLAGVQILREHSAGAAADRDGKNQRIPEAESCPVLQWDRRSLPSFEAVKLDRERSYYVRFTSFLGGDREVPARPDDSRQ